MLVISQTWTKEPALVAKNIHHSSPQTLKPSSPLVIFIFIELVLDINEANNANRINAKKKSKKGQIEFEASSQSIHETQYNLYLFLSSTFLKNKIEVFRFLEKEFDLEKL